MDAPGIFGRAGARYTYHRAGRERREQRSGKCHQSDRRRDRTQGVGPQLPQHGERRRSRGELQRLGRCKGQRINEDLPAHLVGLSGGPRLSWRPKKNFF